MDTWTARELVVLRALVEKFEDVETFSVGIETLLAATGLDESDVRRALRSLYTANPPYLEGVKAQLPYPIIITKVTERARRAVGQSLPVKLDETSGCLIYLCGLPGHDLLAGPVDPCALG